MRQATSSIVFSYRKGVRQGSRLTKCYFRLRLRLRSEMNLNPELGPKLFNSSRDRAITPAGVSYVVSSRQENPSRRQNPALFLLQNVTFLFPTRLAYLDATPRVVGKLQTWNIEAPGVVYCESN